MPLPVPNQTRKFGCVGGIYPQFQGCGAGVCAPTPTSYHQFRCLLPLQISCSPVVAKLICNSCAPSPPPTRLREIKKRALGCCRAGPMLLGWGEWKSTKYRATCAQCFLRSGHDCFSSIFFLQILSPPPSYGLCCFFLNIELTQTCIAIDVPSSPPPPPTWEPRGRQGNEKLIVRYKVFECTTLLKIEAIRYGK